MSPPRVGGGRVGGARAGGGGRAGGGRAGGGGVGTGISIAAATGRSLPTAAPPGPSAPLIAPTGSPGLDCVADVINSTARPFQDAPPAEQGAAGWIAQGLGGVLGVVGAPQMLIDVAIAANPVGVALAAACPAMPAMTLGAMHLGLPHGHTHPPSLVPPNPVPIPLPSIGTVLGAGAITVMINGMPAARAGDIGIAVTCCSLAPPFEIFTGSSNVFIGGARAARMADITLHCNPMAMGPFAIAMGGLGVAAGLAGAVAANDAFKAAQAAADAAVLAFKILCGKDMGVPPGVGNLMGPPSPNVMIGGFPCPPLGDMAVGGILKGLKALAKAAKGKGKAPPRKANCNQGDGGEPIYLVTGEVFCECLDFASGGLFEWRRHYTSARAKEDSPHGHGWRHFYQRTLRRRLHRATFIDYNGLDTEFGRFEPGSDTVRSGGYVLRRVDWGHFRLTHRDDPAMEFIGGEFDSEIQLSKIETAERELVFHYDELGRLATAIEIEKRTEHVRRFDLRYDDSHHITEIWETEPNPAAGVLAKQPVRLTSYRYSPQSELLSATDALGGPWVYEYETFHRLTRQTDPRGYSYAYAYDIHGRCTDSSGKDGLWWCHIDHFPEQGMTRYTEGDNATWEYHYDSDGIVTKIVDPYGGEKTRELDENGNLVLETDSGGRTLRWLYDSDAAHYARVDRFGHVFPPESEMPKLPNPFARELPSTSLGFSFAGRIEPSPEAMLGIEPSLLASVPAELADYARGCFRPRPALAPGSPRVGAREPVVERDALGRKIRETDALGRTRRWHYDPTGNLVASTDREGRVTTQETTSWNLLGARRDPLGNAMSYEYSKLEQIVAITDPLGNTSRYDYDLKERLVRVHRHGRVREEYVYDEGDHFIEKRDGEGRVLFQNGRHQNHLVGVRKLASGGEHRYEYDDRGRIIEASTEAHEVKLRHDALGRRLSDKWDDRGVERRYRGESAVETTVLGRFSWSTTTSEGLTRITDSAGRETLVTHYEAGFVRRHCSSGTTELLQYDEEGRLEAGLCYRSELGRAKGSATRYAYSAEGELVQVLDSERGTTRYTIDAAGRLVGEEGPDGAEVEYFQDAAGNLLSKPGLTRLGLVSGNRVATSPEEAFAYDERDHISERRAQDGTVTRYTYDSFDMLVRIERTEPEIWPWEMPFPNGPVGRLGGGADRGATHVGLKTPWEAAYDALGRRLWARCGGSKREFFWDGDRIAAEVLPSGRVRVYQYATPEALAPLGFVEYESAEAEPESGKSYHVFSNPVGMPLRIEDEAGNVVWCAERVDPYGEIRVRRGAGTEYNLRWPGHYFDPETGLQYNRYRYYDPGLGRYLQSDPIGYEGSPVNLYAYCANPLVEVDVLGLAHPGKTGKNGSEGGDNDGIEGTRPPTLRGVSTEQIALAASPGSSRAQVKARKLIAKRFYKQHGKIWDPEMNGGAGGMRNPSASEARAQLKGIDYSKPVSMGPPPAVPDTLAQWQSPGGRQGQFYTEPGTPPSALGIHDKAADDKGNVQPKVATLYDMNQDQEPYMKSTAAPIKDTWSNPGHSHYAEGGGTQYYVPNKSSTKPAS